MLYSECRYTTSFLLVISTTALRTDPKSIRYTSPEGPTSTFYIHEDLELVHTTRQKRYIKYIKNNLTLLTK